MAFLKENTDLSRAGREIFLAARNVTAVKFRDAVNEPLHLKAINHFFKLVMRKYSIADKRDEEASGYALAQAERDMMCP